MLWAGLHRPDGLEGSAAVGRHSRDPLHPRDIFLSPQFSLIETINKCHKTTVQHADYITDIHMPWRSVR